MISICDHWTIVITTVATSYILARKYIFENVSEILSFWFLWRLFSKIKKFPENLYDAQIFFSYAESKRQKEPF